MSIISTHACLRGGCPYSVFTKLPLNSANEKTLNANKKTIMPPDVFDAMDEIEFGQFRETVQKEFKSTCFPYPTLFSITPLACGHLTTHIINILCYVGS